MKRAHEIVFVGGVHRSGTSLLARILGAHSLVSGFANTGVPEDEGQHLQSVMLPDIGAHVYRRWRRVPWRYAVQALMGGGGRFSFRSYGHLTESSPLATDANAEKLFAEWSPFWDLSRPFLLEKSPPNIVRTRLLQRFFPGCRFILIVRHPVAVAYSTKRLRSVPLSLSLLLRHWIHCHDLFIDDAPHLDRVMVVRYEELVSRPDRVLAGVSAFLGLPEPALTVATRPATNEAHFERWRRLAAGTLTGAYVRSLVRRYEGPVRRLGYSLRDLDLAASDTVLDLQRRGDEGAVSRSQPRHPASELQP